MVNDRWSASRVSCFKDCALKYYYSYVNKYKSNIPVNTEAADKGSAFHETVEHYVTGEDHAVTHARLQEKCAAFNVDQTKYDEKAALERFFLFWDYFVAPREKEGYKVSKEMWFSEKLLELPFVGALDLLLDNGEDCIVVDYKSGSKVNIDHYRLQQILYAYILGQQRGWTNEQIAEKVKLYIFAPFTDTKCETEEDKMLHSIKQINFTKEDVDKIMKDYFSTIKEISLMNWEDCDFDSLGTISFSCRWCPFLGSNPDGEFKGCKVSYNAGFHQLRTTKFVKV